MMLKERLALKPEFKCRNLEDLIEFAQSKATGSFQKRLQRMMPAILDLHAVVGQVDLKDHLLDIILSPSQGKMLNICLFGPPGIGKTRLSEIIAELYYYAAADTLEKEKEKEQEKEKEKGKGKENPHFVVGTRVNLLGKYAGQTAPTTQAVIDECRKSNKCLIVDEIYSLGSRYDPYGEECITVLTQNLSMYPDTFRVIVAGYQDKSEETFFSSNQGLARRFRCYTLVPYAPPELQDIFFQHLSLKGYDVESGNVASVTWFKEHVKEFHFAGASMPMLIDHAIEHASRRKIGLPSFLTNRISQRDCNVALKQLNTCRVGSSSKSDNHDAFMSMIA